MLVCEPSPCRQALVIYVDYLLILLYKYRVEKAFLPEDWNVKRHILLVSNLIIIFAIVAGFAAIVYKDTRNYQDLAEKHLESIVSLADINISKQIENSMSKPVMVSKTMANDEFLKTWLYKEPENYADDTYLEELYGYLKAYQEKYDYTTVFCISDITGNYYYQDGFNKTLSRGDEHDVWYYNFLESGHEYDLQLDTNQASNNEITVFVNLRVDAGDGTLLGVIGVGLQVDFIEDTIRSYERDYGLAVYIINAGGAENSFTGSTEVFVSEEELSERLGISEKIEMNKSDESLMQWFTSGSERKCLITKYNETLGWYLVLEMETSSISSSFHEMIKSNLLFVLISLAACILVTTAVFINYNQRIVNIENTDDLTGLPNRKMFTKQFQAFSRKHHEKKKTLFMLDIDDFKDVNDTYGHIFGNAVLSLVGEKLKSAICGHGFAVRWGGDEFLGILSLDSGEAEQILGRFMDSLKGAEKELHRCITVSVGVIEINGKLTTEQMVKKVDEALYNSKKGGRNRITVCGL